MRNFEYLHSTDIFVTSVISVHCFIYIMLCVCIVVIKMVNVV